MAKLTIFTVPTPNGPVILSHDSEGDPLVEGIAYGVLAYPDGSFVIEAVGYKNGVQHDA